MKCAGCFKDVPYGSRRAKLNEEIVARIRAVPRFDDHLAAELAARLGVSMGAVKQARYTG